jgi:hypothetical protein
MSRGIHAMNRIAALLLVFFPVLVFAQSPVAEQVPSGGSVATEGAGIPRGQNASEYAAEVDRKVTHGGQAAMSLRSIVAKPETFRAVTQFVKADAYRGKRVRLAGYLKTRAVAEFSGLWLRVDGPNGMLSLDNMDRRPVKGTTDWTLHEVVLDVPESAVRLAFGSLLRGAGQVWLDDLTLDVVDPKAIQSTTSYLYDANPAEHTSNLDFEATATDAANPVPGWKFGGYPAGSPSHRIAEAGAHGGRYFLELKATQQGVPTTSVATQDIATAPYKGKRVRFRAYLKTEDVVQEAYLSIAYGTKYSWIQTTAAGRGRKGRSDWQSQDLVFDVPNDPEFLNLSVVLQGVGTVGVDDASVEIVDPAKVALSPESEREKAAQEKRARELAESYPKLSDRPENLNFER